MPAFLGLLLAAAAVSAPPFEGAVDALREWHRRYLAQAFDLSPDAPPGEDRSSVAVLLSLADAAIAQDPAGAARALLDVATRDFGPKREAAIGRDAARLKRLQPLRVRDAAREALFGIRSVEALREVARALAGPRADVAAPPARELAAEWLGSEAAASGPGENTEPLRQYALLRALREDPSEDVRYAAARAIASLAPAPAAPALSFALASTRPDAAPRVRREAAAALGLILSRPGRGDEEGGVALAALLDAVETDAHPGVRAAAIAALGRAPSLATVERLARFLASRPAGREASEFAAIRALLGRITGAFVDETDPGAWLAFWEKERGKARVAPRAAERASDPSEPRYASRFYGVPIVGDRVVFVLDVSGSMAQDGGNPGATKIEEARAELDAAIRGLPDSVRFNVVVFASDVRAWQRGLRRAVPTHKTEARGFFSSIAASGSTDLMGGLLAAFGCDRVGERRRPDDDLPDQIVVLSDGQPSAGLLTDPRDIRLEVRRLNRDDAVRIDAVAIGAGAGLLLQQLAAENGGVSAAVEDRVDRAARAEPAPRR